MITIENILTALTPSGYEQIFLILYVAFTVYSLSRIRVLTNTQDGLELKRMSLKTLFGTIYVRSQVRMTMTYRYLLIMGAIYLALAFFNWNLSLVISLSLTLLYAILALIKIGPSAFRR